MIIRAETPADVSTIRALTEAAFKSVEHSSQTEGAIVDALRAAGALPLSLVADQDGKIVGHIAFSPVLMGGMDLGWFGLGPVSVWPHLQRGGIGSALILEDYSSFGNGVPQDACCSAIPIIIAASGSAAIMRCATAMFRRNISSR